MTRRFYILTTFFLFCFLISPSAHAEFSASERANARSSFAFVALSDWKDALYTAKRSGNPLLYKTVQWMCYRDSACGASFEDISDFIRRNSDWPDQKTLRMRAEEALFMQNPDNAAAWLKQYPPITGKGMLALARTEHSQSDKEKWVRLAWIQGDFDMNQEKDVLRQFGAYLTSKEHQERTDRLLWDEKTQSVARMLAFLPKDHIALAQARIALMQDAPNASTLVDRVPASLKNNPGLLYERMRWRERRGDVSGVDEILTIAPSDVPNPDKWWPLREKHIRNALEDGNPNKAYRLLKNHGQKEGAQQAEALWLSGWIALEHLKKPQQAYKDFYTLYHSVKYPVSKARGAYWAGRAAQRNGNQDIARNWFSQGAAYSFTFYGQLSALKLKKNASLDLPPPHKVGVIERQKYFQKELPRVAMLFDQSGEPERASRVVQHLIDNAPSKQETYLAVELGASINNPSGGVKAAKRASQSNIFSVGHAYPILRLPPNLPIEKALALAITRQESEFDIRARSKANAQGLMQLLPSTAKEIAKKAGISFAPAHLYQADANLRLGSTYINRLVNQFDGSYIMAIAAYNAGPGRVRQWEREFGAPEKNLDAAVNWIEEIPFSETRNYVQRVIENLQVYRHLLEKAPLKIEQDITR